MCDAAPKSLKKWKAPKIMTHLAAICIALFLDAFCVQCIKKGYYNKTIVKVLFTLKYILRHLNKQHILNSSFIT